MHREGLNKYVCIITDWPICSFAHDWFPWAKTVPEKDSKRRTSIMVCLVGHRDGHKYHRNGSLSIKKGYWQSSRIVTRGLFYIEVDW